MKGILTAYHVQVEIRRRGGTFGLTLAEHPHSFFLDRDQYSEIQVGIPDDPIAHAALGPDLVFLRILSPLDIGTVAMKKSFFVVRRFPFDPADLQPFSWFIAGTPAALTEPPEIPGTLNLASLVGGAEFESRREQEDFDYISLKVNSGTHRFPHDYGGLSGGGLWIIPFTKQDGEGPNRLDYHAPILGGVAYYQTAPSDGFQLIIGHGPKSIYKVLPEQVRSLK